jgi:hypothetical protein
MDILDIINITTIKALSKPNQNIPSQTEVKSIAIERLIPSAHYLADMIGTENIA